MSSNINTLFKPITVGSEKSGANLATTSINTFTSTIPSTTTTTTTTTSATAVTAPVVSSTTTTTTTAQKENIRYIPPVFFIGATGTNVDSQDQDVNRAGSIGALEGDRRLSKVFNEEALEAAKNESNSTIKVLLKPESSNRGLFGNGSVEKVGASITEPKLTIAESTGGLIGSEIQVTGYKQGTENVLIDHFSRYGTVVKHETIDGRLLVQFKETSSAISALKSNGFDCEGQQVTVKLHNMTATESDQSDKAEELPVFKKIETPSDLYKRTNKLGSGQSGITALDKNISIKPTDKPKEVSLYTRLLEVILGW